LGITFIYLLVSGHYKKHLPPRSIIYVNVASLLIMPVFGFHFLDPGPAWRFWSGLIYGNAVASLLLPAAFILCNKGPRVAASKLPAFAGTSLPLYKQGALGMVSAKFNIPKLRLRSPQTYSTHSFFVLFAFLNTIPFWFPLQSTLLYYVTLILALTGLLCVLLCLLLIIVFSLKKITALLTQTIIF
jgi:hypothetical protein